MDDLRAIGALLTKPAPSTEVTARGRDRLRAAARGPARRRRFIWPVAALGAAAAATAAIVVVSDLSPTATPNTATPNGPPPPAAVSGRQILLAAATTAETRPAGAGTYWHVKTVYGDSRSSESRESWTRRDGREYWRNGSARPALIHGTTAFDVADAQMTFRRIQELPTSPAALKAEITRLLDPNLLPPGAKVIGPGRNPRLILSLIDLLARVPAPPKVRAAAFRVIAGLPGVTRAGSASGGQTLLIRGDAGDMSLVVDPATSLVRGWSIASPDMRERGAAWMADQYCSIPTAEWTSRRPGE
jgi:hypothetical protein